VTQQPHGEHERTTPEPDLAPPVRQPGAFDLAFLTGIPNVTEMYLVRHAQQEIDFAGPVGELVDPPLSEKGVQQAQAVGLALGGQKLDAVYCSGLRRAMVTAGEIAKHQGLEPVVMDDLREVEIWRDMPQDRSIADHLGTNYLTALRERMVQEKIWDVYPFSESSFEFRRRTVNAVEAILATHPGQRIAVVCHGGVINAYTGHLIRTPYDMYFRPAHASISMVMAGHGRRALRRLNDCNHLTAHGLETY
jgi:2,3-bisphosphoglycerate-dependent phosphoglycerate mutase